MTRVGASPSSGFGAGDLLRAKASELAQLSRSDYESCRVAEAKALSVRLGVLDREVGKARSSGGTRDGVPDPFEDVEPWPVPVDGAALARSIRDVLRAHVVFAKPCHADAAALWLMGTYLMDSWTLWPKMLISSPERRCGKTTLLEVMEAYAHRALIASNITAAGLFRAIEAWRPTLLLDEADRFVSGNEELNGIINAGHRRRTAVVIRVEERGGKHVPTRFSVWAPLVIAGIGAQADTLADRSLRISLRRKLRDERTAKLPASFFEGQRDARRMAARWAADHAQAVEVLNLEPPALDNDRAQDNWTPLTRIAAVLGSEWPERAADAYRRMEAAVDADEESPGVLLLRDAAGLLERHAGRMGSAQMCAALVALEAAPWGEWRDGRPLSPRAMTRLLKAYGIVPIRDHRGSSYLLSDFADALARYAPSTPRETATTATAAASATELISENKGPWQNGSCGSSHGSTASMADGQPWPSPSDGKIRS